MSEEQMENLNENNDEKESEETKKSLFSKLGQGAQEAGKWFKDKCNESKEKSAEKEALDATLKKQANEFYIVYKDSTKKNKKILGIIDERNKIIRTEYDIILPNKIKYIQDARQQEYYIIIVKTEKYPFTITFNNKVLVKELFQIEYTNDKQKQEITYIIDNSVDNSIYAGKGANVGDNISTNKKNDFNIGIHLPN